MSDLHSLAGRTMSAGEAALRAKMKSLSRILLNAPNPDVNNAGQLIHDVLTGEFDPRQDEVEL